MLLRQIVISAVVAGIGLTAAGAAYADYPDRTVKIIVPFAPGGSTDILARILAEEFSEEFGQPFIVENKAGAAGNIGGSYVARSKPDGYTLMIAAAGPTVINPSLYEDMGFSPVDDLAPITAITREHNIMAVNADSDIHNLQEFFEVAKNQDEPLSFGSPGIGTPGHLAGELLKHEKDLNLTHVPYKGSGPAVVDLVAGHIDFMIDNMPPLLPQIEAGKLRAIAVPSLERSQATPEVPTFKESGMDDYVIMAWKGLMAPAGTPDDIIHALYEATQKIVHQPEIAERLSGLGAEPEANTPEEYAQQIQDETAWWAELIELTGTRLD